MISKAKVLSAVFCIAVLASSCGGGGEKEKTIKNDKLHSFLLGGIYAVNGYGGSDTFFKIFSDGMDTKPDGRGFLTELNEAYEFLFIFPYKSENTSETRRELSRSWDINNKEDFMETANFLLVEGHQKAYEFCRKVLDDNGGEQANVNQIDLDKYASEYDGRLGQLKNIKFVKDNYTKFSKSGIKAWDLTRYVNNVNLAFDAGYITEEEGYRMASKALAEARKYYQDWDEYWNDFNLGRYFWGGDDDPSFTRIAKSLTDQENPYSIYLYMPLQ